MPRPPERREATAVIDASALLAYVHDEEGGDRLPRLVGDAPTMSAVNWSEVVQKSLQIGVALDPLRRTCEEAGIEIQPFTATRAEAAAELWPAARPLGLSLADRACLALALELGVTALTADRAWAELRIPDLRVEVLHRS